MGQVGRISNSSGQFGKLSYNHPSGFLRLHLDKDLELVRKMRDEEKYNGSTNQYNAPGDYVLDGMK